MGKDILEYMDMVFHDILIPALSDNPSHIRQHEFKFSVKMEQYNSRRYFHGSLFVIQLLFWIPVLCYFE